MVKRDRLAVEDGNEHGVLSRCCLRISSGWTTVVPELKEVHELGPMEYVILAHYSGGVGVGLASARVNRQPDQAPTLSEWRDD